MNILRTIAALAWAILWRRGAGPASADSSVEKREPPNFSMLFENGMPFATVAWTVGGPWLMFAVSICRADDVFDMAEGERIAATRLARAPELLPAVPKGTEWRSIMHHLAERWSCENPGKGGTRVHIAANQALALHERYSPKPQFRDIGQQTVVRHPPNSPRAAKDMLIVCRRCNVVAEVKAGDWLGVCRCGSAAVV